MTLPPVLPRGDYERLAQGFLDEGDLSIVMAHIAGLPPGDLAKLAAGPHVHEPLACRVCDVLKDADFPNEPADRSRHAGYMLVKWHNGGDGKAMYERCLVIYLAARLRIAEEYTIWLGARNAA